MAIDNAGKRKSVAGIHRSWRGAGVTPNTLKDQEWRQQAGRSYSGILATAPGGGTNAVFYLIDNGLIDTGLVNQGLAS